MHNRHSCFLHFICFSSNFSLLDPDPQLKTNRIQLFVVGPHLTMTMITDNFESDKLSDQQLNVDLTQQLLMCLT